MSGSLNMTRTVEHETIEKDRWFTQSQLAGHYNLPIDHLSILNIVNKKKALGLFRLHVEAPEDPFMTMYDCMAEMSKAKKESRKFEQNLSVALDAADPETAATLVQNSLPLFAELHMPGLPRPLHPAQTYAAPPGQSTVQPKTEEVVDDVAKKNKEKQDREAKKQMLLDKRAMTTAEKEEKMKEDDSEQVNGRTWSSRTSQTPAQWSPS